MRHINGTPPTRLVPAGQVPLADLATRIREAHASVVSASNSMIDNAVIAGKLLIEAKKQTPHGQWTKFLKRCDVGERQSQRYIKVAELVEANPTCKSDLADLSIERVIKLLSPPKSPGKSVTAKQPNERSKSGKQPALKTGHADILAAWLNAPVAERTHALDGIGLGPLLAAMPSAWWPLIQKHIADRQKSSAPTIEATALANNPRRPVPDDDLPIPDFLRRELPPGFADATPEIPDSSTAENDDASVDGAEDGAEDDVDEELADLERRAAERARKVKLVEHTTEVGGALQLAFETLQELASECREVVESTPENLQQTERIQALENSVDQLEDLTAPEVPDAFGKVPTTYSLPKRRYKSREARASDITTILEACTHTLESVPDGDEHRAAAQALAGELQTAIDTIQSCEFPGPYQQ
jgi:hypothetical protein